MAIKVLDKYAKIPLVTKIGVLVALVVVVLGYFYFTAWTKLDKKVVALKMEQENLNRQFKEQQSVAENLATFKENTKKLEEDLQIALKQLPKDKEIPTLLRDIYTLGRKSGVDFKVFEPQKQQNKSLYAELPVKLSIFGSYHEVGVFFDRIGKMSRIVNISDLDVQISKSSDGGMQLQVNCVATTFMFLGVGRENFSDSASFAIFSPVHLIAAPKKDSKAEKADKKAPAKAKKGKGKEVEEEKAPTDDLSLEQKAVEEPVFIDPMAYTYNPFGKRDPFEPFIREGDAKQQLSADPLLNFDLAKFVLTGIVWGLSSPRAVVVDGNGHGHIISKGTHIGRNRGKVMRILKDEVVVAEEFRDPLGKLIVTEFTMKLEPGGKESKR